MSITGIDKFQDLTATTPFNIEENKVTEELKMKETPQVTT